MTMRFPLSVDPCLGDEWTVSDCDQLGLLTVQFPPTILTFVFLLITIEICISLGQFDI